MRQYTIALSLLLITGSCFAECNVDSIDKSNKQQIYDGLQCVNKELDNVEAEIDNTRENGLRVERENKRLVAEDALCDNQKAIAKYSNNALDIQLANECSELYHARQSKLSDIMEEYGKLKSNFQLLQDTKTRLKAKRDNLEFLFNSIGSR